MRYLRNNPSLSLRPRDRFPGLAAPAALALLLAAGFAACGDETNPDQTSATSGSAGAGGSDPCPGGHITEEGVCEGKCEPSKCLEQNTCVENRCVLTCDAHADCALDGTQRCAPAEPDDPAAGESVLVCQADPLVPGPGFFTQACPFGTECAEFACPDGVECDPSACGGDPAACVRDPACGEDPRCNRGSCADGAPCVATLCEPSACAPTKSVCKTAGIADADAYCTQLDCQSDDDCVPGYYCGIQREPNDICGNTCVDGACSHDPEIACEEDAHCQKGNNNFCGKTEAPCVDLAEAASSGGTHFEGSICLLRRVCLKREPCAPCETDLDCSYLPGQKCAALPDGGGNVCAPGCASDKDCSPEFSCTEGSCLPRFGKCAGEKTFCAPCLSDEDCGSKQEDPSDKSRWACVSVSGTQRGCFDLAFPDTCETDADCPESPGGLRGQCLDEGEGIPSTEFVYKRCYLPFKRSGPLAGPQDGRYSCW